MKLKLPLLSLAVLLGVNSLPAASYTFVAGNPNAPIDTLREGSDMAYGYGISPADGYQPFDISVLNSYQTTKYNPSLHNITSATVYFAFADDQNGPDGSTNDIAEYVDIVLGGASPTTVFNDHQIDGTHADGQAYPFTGSYHWVSYVLTGSLLNDLKADGKLDYLIQLQLMNSSNYTTAGYGWKQEDTVLKIAWLAAEGSDKPPTSVPDNGSTAVLLGLGIMGAIALRKQLRF